MMPVNQAENSVSSKIKVTIPCVGPFWILPVRLSSQSRHGLMANIKSRIHPIVQSTTYNAVIPDPLFTSATQRASSTHPTTSFPTPAASTVTPTGVPSKLSSVRIRHSTGNAVILNAVPINSIYTPKLIGTIPSSSLNW